MNRRHFFLGAAASLAQAQNGRKLGTGLIGAGNRGSLLLEGILKQDTAKLTALCDIKPDRLDRAASSASKDNPATISDWRRLIERKDVDVVFIATPPHQHSEMAIAALNAGKHVYCEKPVGIDPDQVRKLVSVARAAKTVFTSGQQLRSMRSLSSAVRKIHDGIIGEVVMIQAQRQAGADLPHDGSSGDWYFDVTKSGGYLIEQSVHNLDLCNWVAGRHPVSAAGFGGNLFYKNDPPGRGHLRLRQPGVRIPRRFSHVVYPECLPPARSSREWPVYSRFRRQRSRRSNGIPDALPAIEDGKANSPFGWPARRSVRPHGGVLRRDSSRGKESGGYCDWSNGSTYGYSGPPDHDTAKNDRLARTERRALFGRTVGRRGHWCFKFITRMSSGRGVARRSAAGRAVVLLEPLVTGSRPRQPHVRRG